MAILNKQFSLTKPCSNCPFRNDNKAIELSLGRKEQIIEDLLSGEATTFHCHKTVYRADNRNFDGDDKYTPVDVCQCAGAAAVARKYGRDTVMVQVATRLGAIPIDHYDQALPLTINKTDLDIDFKRARITNNKAGKA